jgi:hypothetical protein
MSPSVSDSVVLTAFRDSPLSSCQANRGCLLETGKMKAAFSLLVLIATMNLARAGSFAGPPPFTNDSPLPSGTDGTYQAVASGINLTGVFSFVISGGLQTSDQSTTINGWVFFVDGNIFQGSVLAAISQSKVVGLLNGGATALPFETGEPLTLPAAFVVPGNTASGEFSGSISLNSPVGAFDGEGTLQGTPERTDQVLFIDLPSQTNSFITTTNTVLDPNGVVQQINVTSTPVANPNTNISQVPLVIPATGIPRTEFDFRGTRVSTTPATPPAAPAPAPSPAA